MTPDERRHLEALRELDEDSNMVLEDINMQDILNGDAHLDISHAGGEFAALAAELNKDLWKTWVISCLSLEPDLLGCSNHHQIPRRFDGRTRHDRTERRERAFDKQMNSIAESYMDWSLKTSYGRPVQPEPGPSDGSITINIIGLYSEQ